MKKEISRRKFMKTTALAGSAAAVMPKNLFSYRKKTKVKLGFIGTGLRGQWMLWLSTKYPELEISAICDIDDGMPLEEYNSMAGDFFIDELPSMANKPGYFTGKVIPPSIKHTFSSGKIPYQLLNNIRKIVDPISSRIWNDWTSSEYFG